MRHANNCALQPECTKSTSKNVLLTKSLNQKAKQNAKKSWVRLGEILRKFGIFIRKGMKSGKIGWHLLRCHLSPPYVVSGVYNSKGWLQWWSGVTLRWQASRIYFDFGQIGYEHFKDSTPLKLYSKDDHNDQKRRELYRNRFRHLYDPEVYSPTYFSWNYLWWKRSDVLSRMSCEAEVSKDSMSLVGIQVVICNYISWVSIYICCRKSSIVYWK